MGTSARGIRVSFARPRACAALALGAVFALASPLAAQQPTTSSPLGGHQLAELSLSEGQLVDLDLPDRLLGPLELPLAVDGELYTLVLEPESLRAADFRVLVSGPDGLLSPAGAPAPRTLRGRIQGLSGSLAAGSLADDGLHLLLRLHTAGPIWAIQPLRDGGHALYPQSAVVGSGSVCGTFAPRPATPPQQQLSAVGPGSVVHVAEIGLDADHEYFLLHSGSVESVVADLEGIIAKTRVIYSSSVAISYKITTIMIRTDANDPYTSGAPSGLLGQFRSTWNQTMVGVPRDVAHLFTGRILGAAVGVGYLDVICQKSQAYGLSQSLVTNNIVQRVAITAHELGHNWSSPHCDGAPDCAIMCSILGFCSGDLQSFGAFASAKITQKKESVNCLDIVNVPGQPWLSSVFPTAGRAEGGGVLELHGYNMPTEITPTVTMNGIVAEVLSTSESLVTVTIPPGTPGTVVDVALSNGTTLTELDEAYRYDVEMSLGDDVTSSFEPMEIERFYFHGLAGSRVTMKSIPLDDLDGLIAGLRLVGPGEAELVKVESTVLTRGAPVSVKKYELPETGEYRIEAYAIGITSGAYHLKTRGYPVKAMNATLQVSSSKPDPVLTFGADAGTLLKLALFKRIKPKGKFAAVDGEPADLVPTLLGLTGPDGPVTFDDELQLSPKGKFARVKQLVLTVSGDYTLRLGGLEGSIGHGKARVKLKPPKPVKESYVFEG